MKNISIFPKKNPTHVAVLPAETIDKVRSMIQHPRSLTRPTAQWRPPVAKLHSPPGASLNAAISRHRVGPMVSERMRLLGFHNQPAYLVTVRITSPTGKHVPSDVAREWVTAIVGNAHTHAVHELLVDASPTFAWMVDGRFRPVASPAEIFGETESAA